jgi:hypothetical protein
MANWLNLVLEMFCINVAARLIVDITSNNLTKNISVQILYMELCLRCSEPNDWMQNNQEGALYSPTVGMLTNIWCVSFVSIQKRKRFRSRKSLVLHWEKLFSLRKCHLYPCDILQLCNYYYGFTPVRILSRSSITILKKICEFYLLILLFAGIGLYAL